MGKVRRFDFNVSIETPDIPSISTVLTNANSPSGKVLLSEGQTEVTITFDTELDSANYTAIGVMRDETNQGLNRPTIVPDILFQTTTQVKFKLSTEVQSASTYFHWMVASHG